MVRPSSARYHGTVEGRLIDVSLLEIDYPLVGMEVTIQADGKIIVNVDGQDVLRVTGTGALLKVSDHRTGYKHEAVTE